MPINFIPDPTHTIAGSTRSLQTAHRSDWVHPRITAPIDFTISPHPTLTTQSRDQPTRYRPHTVATGFTPGSQCPSVSYPGPHHTIAESTRSLRLRNHSITHLQPEADLLPLQTCNQLQQSESTDVVMDGLRRSLRRGRQFAGNFMRPYENSSTHRPPMRSYLWT